MEIEAPNAFFRGSPFSLLASEESAKCWAGREALHDQLAVTCRMWHRRPDSTVDLMWANLGAGKTHTLLHLPHLYNELAPGQNPIFVFVEFPQDLASFKDLYCSIATKLPLDELLGAAMHHSSDMSLALQRAARAYVSAGNIARDTVYEWITGGRPLLRELRSTTGISSRIELETEAEQTLIELLKIARLEKRRVIIMLDEFQRIANLQPKAREKVLSHLRTVISRSPTHLSVLFAVASKVEKSAVQLLPPEIRTIMGMRQLIALPALNIEDARTFISNRMRWFRPTNYSGGEFDPLAEETVDQALQAIVAKLDGRLTPRMLLQVIGVIYDCALDGGLPGWKQVEDLLGQLRWEDL